MRWPTDKQAMKQAYDHDGFVVTRGFFGESEVRDLQAQLDRYVQDVVPRLPPMDAFFDDKPTKHHIRMLSRMEQHDAYFKQLLLTGTLPTIAAELCGSDVVPQDAAFFNKLPIVGDETPPHQDGFYFHLEPCLALTLWVALDEVDKNNGCIYYVRGSHRRGMRQHNRTNVLGFSQGIVDYGTAEDICDEVAASVSPGDVIIHNAMTIHRADKNTSPRPRRALGFVYFSATATIDRESSDQYQQQLASQWQAEGKI